MDSSIFKKMKAKAGMAANIICPPPDYPTLDGFNNVNDGKYEFVHLFVTSKQEFAERFDSAAELVADNSLLWVSYPKSTRKQAYDINRDSLWHLVLPLGWHPVAQVSLNDKWSAVRLKRNEPSVMYEHPKNVKGAV